MEPAVLPRPVGHSRPIRVLVVDDNAGFRESLLSLLEAGNLQVVGEAGSGAEALGLVRSLSPDVVLMDVRMPTMDGIEATRLLKADFPDLGVVALSGHEDQEIVRGMLVAGASGYVLKDSDGDEILTAVSRAAEGGALLSSQVTPRVIEELTEALERERRRIRELEAAQAALVERSARRQQLVARLSHELRTPVTVILGVAQTLAEVESSPEQEEELLARLVTRARDLAQLVERFELAIDAGLTERVDVGEVAREVAAREPEPRRRRSHPGGARRQRAPLLERQDRGGGHDRGRHGCDRGPGGGRGAGDRPPRPRTGLRAARAAGGAQRPDPPRDRHGARARAHRRPRDGRRRRDRVVERRRKHVPVDDRPDELTWLRRTGACAR
jgi:DNA-binding NarL/FixJ family response regulator